MYFTHSCTSPTPVPVVPTALPGRATKVPEKEVDEDAEEPEEEEEEEPKKEEVRPAVPSLPLFILLPPEQAQAGFRAAVNLLPDTQIYPLGACPTPCPTQAIPSPAPSASYFVRFL